MLVIAREKRYFMRKMNFKKWIFATFFCGAVLNFSSCQDEELKTQIDDLEQKLALNDYDALQKTVEKMQIKIASLTQENGDSASVRDFEILKTKFENLQNSLKNLNRDDEKEIEKTRSEIADLQKLLDLVKKPEISDEPKIKSVNIFQRYIEDGRPDTIYLSVGEASIINATCVPWEEHPLFSENVFEWEFNDFFGRNVVEIEEPHGEDEKKYQRLIWGKSQGVGYFKVSLGEGAERKSDSIVVKVYNRVQSVKITNHEGIDNNYSTYLKKGEKVRFNAEVIPEEFGYLLKWKSSDPTKVAVDEKTGEVTALEETDDRIDETVYIYYELEHDKYPDTGKPDKVRFSLIDHNGRIDTYRALRVKVYEWQDVVFVCTGKEEEDYGDDRVWFVGEKEEEWIGLDIPIDGLQDGVKYNLTDYDAYYISNIKGGKFSSGTFELYENGEKIKFDGIIENFGRVYTED